MAQLFTYGGENTPHIPSFGDALYSEGKPHYKNSYQRPYVVHVVEVYAVAASDALIFHLEAVHSEV